MDDFAEKEESQKQNFKQEIDKKDQEITKLGKDNSTIQGKLDQANDRELQYQGMNVSSVRYSIYFLF